MKQRNTTLTARLPEGFLRSRESEGAACDDEIWRQKERETKTRENERKGVAFDTRSCGQVNFDHLGLTPDLDFLGLLFVEKKYISHILLIILTRLLKWKSNSPIVIIYI